MAGIFQNAARNPYQANAQPGDFKYEDLTGEGSINNEDRTFLGSAVPKYNYGISLYGEYKGWDLTVDMYGQGGNKLFNAKRVRQFGGMNYDVNYYENRWKGEGTSNENPSADLDHNENKMPNTWYLESGAFFKVRNIQLGYTLPEKFVKGKLGLSNIRLYLTASNPINIFKYNGFTPEIVPQLHEEKDDLTSQGIDRNVAPMSVVYNFGINITF